MNVRVFYVLVLLFVHLFVGSVSSANLSEEWMHREYSKAKLHKYVKYIDSRKEELYLKHRSYNDLLETIEIAKEEFASDPVFTLSDVTAIMLKESKFDQYAINKNDGGRGLGQLTNIKGWWKEELAFIDDPFDKRQNIKGIRKCLNSFYSKYGNKYKAIKHYNGSTFKSDLYAQSVIKMSKELKIHI